MEDNESDGMNEEELNGIMEYEFNHVKESGILDYGFDIKPQKEKDYTKWDMIMKALEDSEYKGGQYLIEVEFIKDYPLNIPKFTFITPIYHCNVKENGELEVNWLNKGMTIGYIMPRLMTLFYLQNPDVNKNSERSKLYKNNIEEFKKNIKKNVETEANKKLNFN